MEQRSVLIYGAAESTEELFQHLEKRGWRYFTANNRQELNTLYHHHRFDVVIVYLNERYFLESSLFEELASINIASKWIAILEQENWFEIHPNFLFNNIFYDYHREPLRFEYFLATLGHAYGMAQLQSRQLNQAPINNSDDDFIGQAPSSLKLKRQIGKVAEEDACVFITGESGTGKELVARNIHHNSHRADQPFTAINCAAIPESFFYSELFGHDTNNLVKEKSNNAGQIESTNGGTLFLDEIGDIPYSLQTNLLRFLESSQIASLAASESAPLDCRVLVATNVDLQQAVQEGKFREDLYHRINVLHIKIPPLRERQEDITLLANYYLQHFTKGKAQKSFSQSCYSIMQQYHWPGNVRELMNRVQRAVILSDGNLINEKHLDLNFNAKPYITSMEEARGKAEKEAIILSIEHSGYNHTLAAKNLGISRTSLYRLLNKHNIPM